MPPIVTHSSRPENVESASDPASLGALFTRHQREGMRLQDGTVVLKLDPVTLAPTATVTLDAIDPELLRFVGDGRAAFVDEEEDDVYVLVAARRFRFGAVSLGVGAARHFAADGQGRTWAALPWTGEVIRVTPRSTPRR